MLLMAMDAAVPMTVAISADKNAINRVFCRAAMMLRLANGSDRRVQKQHNEHQVEILKESSEILSDLIH